jgi:cell division cycle 20-like protein 1, cofactor of APC complex
MPETKPSKEPPIMPQNFRKIPQEPFKVLDAPSLQDDYYLNLLDWSDQNFIAVGLERDVYTWNASNNKVLRLFEVEDGESVCSVAWSKREGILGMGDSSGSVKIFDVGKQKVVRNFQGHMARVGLFRNLGLWLGMGT